MTRDELERITKAATQIANDAMISATGQKTFEQATGVGWIAAAIISLALQKGPVFDTANAILPALQETKQEKTDPC